ncbi:MAG: hypothetical protein ACQKBT_12065 [Puniceicoccales bacterium]
MSDGNGERFLRALWVNAGAYGNLAGNPGERNSLERAQPGRFSFTT